jgi:hypothetical protein
MKTKDTGIRIKKKVRKFSDIANHEACMFVDTRDWDSENPYDGASIIIGLETDWICSYNECGCISALTRRDAIRYFNNIYYDEGFEARREAYLKKQRQENK